MRSTSWRWPLDSQQALKGLQILSGACKVSSSSTQPMEDYQTPVESVLVPRWAPVASGKVQTSQGFCAFGLPVGLGTQVMALNRVTGAKTGRRTSRCVAVQPVSEGLKMPSRQVVNKRGVRIESLPPGALGCFDGLQRALNSSGCLLHQEWFRHGLCSGRGFRKRLSGSNPEHTKVMSRSVVLQSIWAGQGSQRVGFHPWGNYV